MLNTRSFPAAHSCAVIATLAVLAGLPAPAARAQCLRQIQYEEGPITDSVALAQTKCYYFQGTVGDVVRLNKDWNNNQLNLVARIEGPGSTPLCSANSNVKQIDCTLTQTGTHRLYMHDSTLNFAGTYTFQIKRLNGITKYMDLCYGLGPTSGSVASPTSENCYKFLARQGSKIQINRTWNNNQVNLWSEILDKDGKQVVAIGGTSQFSFTIPATAQPLDTYTLLVRDASLHFTGPYSLQLLCLSAGEACPCHAIERHYGNAWPGTNGRSPEITISALPRLGTTVTFAIDNSSRKEGAPAFLYIGFAEASVPTSFGGTLHLDSVVPAVSMPLPANGLTFPFDIPNDVNLCDVAFYFQVVQADLGASHGVSFSQGFNLVFGR